jgi:hypothetical protein
VTVQGRNVLSKTSLALGLDNLASGVFAFLLILSSDNKSHTKQKRLHPSRLHFEKQSNSEMDKAN